MLKMKQYIKKAMAVLLVAVLVAGIAAPAAEAAVKKVTVTTQAELEAALAEAAKTGEKIKIKIKSADKTTFTIPEGNYPGVKLVVKAENAKIKNHGAVRALEVKDAKKFVEFATGNTIEIEDSKVEVNVKKGASVENLKFTKAEAENTVVINGSVKKVVVAETMDMNLVVNGAVATVKVKADAELTIAGKTETAPVVKAAAEVEVKVENKTETEIVVKDAEGNETKVEAGATTEDTTTEDTGSTGGTTGGSTGGYVPTPSTPVVVTPKVTAVYDAENDWTTYTLTNADSFEALKSANVTVKTEVLAGLEAGITKNVTVTDELTNLWAKAKKAVADEESMNETAWQWCNYESGHDVDAGGDYYVTITDGNNGSGDKYDVLIHTSMYDLTSEMMHMRKDVVVDTGRPVLYVVMNDVEVQNVTSVDSIECWIANGYLKTRVSKNGEIKVYECLKRSETQFIITGDTTNNIIFNSVTK